MKIFALYLGTYMYSAIVRQIDYVFLLGDGFP